MFSVHDHAINITPEVSLEAPDAVPPLISVIDREGDLTAASLLLAEIPTGARVGDAIQAEADIDANRDSDKSFDGGVLTIAHPLSGARRDMAAALQHALTVHGVPGGFLSLVCGNHPDTSFALRARQVLASYPFEAALPHLVGLGPGSTPSGDDFICGALAANELLGKPFDTGSIGTRIGATTKGGEVLLWLATRGSFPKYLCEFAHGIHGAAAETVAAAVVKAASHGETSGTDSVCGFLYALRAQR